MGVLAESFLEKVKKENEITQIKHKTFVFSNISYFKQIITLSTIEGLKDLCETLFFKSQYFNPPNFSEQICENCVRDIEG